MSDTRCVFCGKRPEEADEGKVMLLNDKIYRCYCVTLEEYRARSASESNEQPSDSGSRPSKSSMGLMLKEEDAYGNDCKSGNCEV